VFPSRIDKRNSPFPVPTAVSPSNIQWGIIKEALSVNPNINKNQFLYNEANVICSLHLFLLSSN